jgi:phosphate transport system permease protein
MMLAVFSPVGFMSTNNAAKAYTGRSRRKHTPWTVRAGDVVAKWSITVGGIGTIVAVSLVFLFLFAVVLPLFLPAKFTNEQRHHLTIPAEKLFAHGVDETQTLEWLVSHRGNLRLLHLASGQEILDRPLLADSRATAVCKVLAADEIAIGSEDGAIRVGTFSIKADALADIDSLPVEIRKLPPRGHAVDQDRLVTRTSDGQWRSHQWETKVGTPLKVANSAIRLLDYLPLSSDGLSAKEYLIAYYSEDGQYQVCHLTEQENAITGEKTLESKNFPLPIDRRSQEPPLRILITGRGENVYLVWRDGTLQRFDIRSKEKIVLAEQLRLVADGQASVNDCRFVLGRETLVVADSKGGLRAWFRTSSANDVTLDGQQLTMVHDMTHGRSAVTEIAPSERGRAIVAGYADGYIRLFQVTTERRFGEKRIAVDQPVIRVSMAPKENGLLAATAETLWIAELDPRHPEVTASSLFRPVWYEGYDGPEHIWQSSYATSAPEMKMGLTPLVFGTLKATLYTMLFAAPLALLAAVYTSEFMHPRTRSIVKPMIEMMASLPSVVLGFLAAIVFAPVIERHITAAIGVIFLAPMLYVLAAHLWQILPQRLLLRWQRVRLPALFFPLPLAILASLAWEPTLERWLFAGDVMRWLDHQIGSGIGGWLLLWVPMCSVITLVLLGTQVNPMLRGIVERCGRTQYVLLSLLKFLLAVAFTIALAFVISWLLNSAGWDPRGSYVATYVQRNAFVVGIVMGFAVIPIIYTLADDALIAVPQHLRSASLACGATPWQTAIRVVVPTAMSGLFSALMIGLGRAVGETMVVLMAGGNTAVLEWNIFNGFRTLSANIATELPEAVRDSTHYRTLFLAALTLFLLTFCLNTMAEVVRLRFRKRAYQL